MADTHDRVPAIAEFLDRFAAKGATMVMHAGDFCSPFSLAPFHQRGIALLGVFGRNDGDRETLSAYAARGMGTEIYESPHSFEVAGKRILDRKSTRLNSSHVSISYAVFCLKKKNRYQ